MAVSGHGITTILVFVAASQVFAYPPWSEQQMDDTMTMIQKYYQQEGQKDTQLLQGMPYKISNKLL